MHLNDPWFLVLLPLVAALVIYAKKRERDPSVLFPSKKLFSNLKPTFKVRLSRSLVLLRIAALLFIVLALCRPMSVIEETRI